MEVKFLKTLYIWKSIVSLFQNLMLKISMKIALLVGLGSFIGGIMRYVLSSFVQAKFYSIFPIGTLIVNIIGCFFIGLVFAMAERSQIAPETRFFLATGILGGFTTFSAFSNETLGLLREGMYGMAVGYVTAALVLGIIATWIGYMLLR